MEVNISNKNFLEEYENITETFLQKIGMCTKFSSVQVEGYNFIDTLVSLYMKYKNRVPKLYDIIDMHAREVTEILDLHPNFLKLEMEAINIVKE